MQILANDGMRFFIGIHDVARKLRHRSVYSWICTGRKWRNIGFAALLFQGGVVDGIRMDPGRSSGFKPHGTQPEGLQRLCEFFSGEHAIRAGIIHNISDDDTPV